MQRKNRVVYNNLPVETFDTAHRLFISDIENNNVLKDQYESKRTKRDKIKFLRFMGYLSIK